MRVGQQKLRKGVTYPGLHFTASQIGAHFPKSKIYVEPFSGAARTAKYARAEKIILNDMGKFANYLCKKLYPNAIITHEDFIECIKKHDSQDTFFLIDPPWDLQFYDKSGKMKGATELNNFQRSKRKEKGCRNSEINLRRKMKNADVIAQSSFIDRPVKQYLKDLENILSTLKGNYIVTLGNKQKIKAPYSKLITHNFKALFSNYPKTMLFSNMPLEIRIPQITGFM